MIRSIALGSVLALAPLLQPLIASSTALLLLDVPPSVELAGKVLTTYEELARIIHDLVGANVRVRRMEF